MLRKIVLTEADSALTIARVVLGFIFFVHGSQLMLGWFGGHGLSGSIQFFTQQLGVPAVSALLAICAQFFGGLLLILVLAGRVAAIGIIGNMVVAVALAHWQFGLFMNWFCAQKGEGFEHHLSAFPLVSVVVMRGFGALSLDRLLLKWRGSATEEADALGMTAAPVLKFQT
jgi:putative oxidoreductase